MFNEKQKKILICEIDPIRIRSRAKGNINLSYLEGFDLIETANTIFGFGNWSYTITTLEQVSQETNHNQNIVICYKAIIKILVNDIEHQEQIFREDIGFGTGISKSLADAHESAGKEAVTDAIKRSLRSFGNQFGNSLYDKSRKHQNTPNTQQYQQPNNTQNFNPPPQIEQNHFQQPQPQIQNNMPQDFTALTNIGLTVIEQGQNLIVFGDDIFSKKDSIKSFGFRWDGASKFWYKPIEQKAA